MHQQDGEVVSALDLAQAAEHGRDIRRGVFLDACHSHEGVEDHEAWFEFGDDGTQASEIDRAVEPEDRDVEQV
ncbi:MAG: hypothetical protein ABIP48_13105, partial [Planctomycetota bacterium]